MKCSVRIILISVLISGAYAGIDEQWQEYKKTYKKEYRSPAAENIRRNLFEKEVNYIEEHNEKFRQGLVSYEVGLNEFSIYTPEERTQYLSKGVNISNILQQIRSVKEEPVPQTRFFLTPAALDWREKGVINAVKNQAQCGSCWIFAATASVEATYAIYKGLHVSLSEQQLVDCLRGCEGGWPGSAIDFMKSRGLQYDSDYPYTAQEQQCRNDNSKAHVTASGYLRLPSGIEWILQAAVAWHGPVVATIQVEEDFERYKSGVFYSKTCVNTPYSYYVNHAVVVVGYGRENGQDYWLVRNSWGANWGDNGYIKMARYRGNNCAIASWALYPKI